MICLALACAPASRWFMPTIRLRRAFFAAAIIFLASCRVVAMGFSTSTSSLRLSDSIDCGACSALGVQTATASSFSLSSILM